MPITRVAKLYDEWREYEDHLNTLDGEEEINAGLEVQFRRERRMSAARSETLADLAMKLIAMSDEGHSLIREEYQSALIDEAKAIIGWTERPGTVERRRQWEEAEAARIAA